MFRYGGGGYHCVHMSPEDLDIFAEHSLYAITNPASNLKLASGIAPVSYTHLEQSEFRYHYRRNRFCDVFCGE